jgi:hypothetical protein
MGIDSDADTPANLTACLHDIEESKIVVLM